MSSSFGKNYTVTLFGESHGDSIGAVIGGLPAGTALDLDAVREMMKRRAPGGSSLTTARKEEDMFSILSGFYNGHTTGTPLSMVIKNSDKKSADYKSMETLARPGHADYTGFLRYSGYNDPRGGGHFSARITAPLVFAGAVAKQVLLARGIKINAFVKSVYGIEDEVPPKIDSKAIERLLTKKLPVFSDLKMEKMITAIENAKKDGDSVGGVVSCIAFGVPPGIGSPIFRKAEHVISEAVFAVPAVKGIEFGAGFACAGMRGHENNDQMHSVNGEIKHKSNNHGGILGGITSGEDITLNVAFKPTPSIAMEQDTINFLTCENAKLSTHGRHDPCVVPRAVVCVEAATAVAVLDLLLD